MAREELSCKICSADVPLAGDEKSGDEVYCTYCGAPFRLKGDASSDDCDIEEDD